MKISLVILLSFLLISSLFSAPKQSGWEEDGLKGKVKERTVIVKHYDDPNKPGEEVKEKGRKSIYKYDEKGNHVELEYDYFMGFSSLSVYDKKGNMVTKGDQAQTYVASKSIFKFDDKGNKVEEAKCNANGGLIEKLICKYDDSGKKTEQERYNSEVVLTNISIYKYDGNGIENEIISHDVVNGKSSKTIIKYNEMGNEETEIYDEKGTLKFKSRHVRSGGTVKGDIKHDEKGNMIEESEFCESGALFRKLIYKYDEKGKRVEGIIYNANGDLTGKYIYKYDDKDNEIEYSDYDGKGKLRRITATSYTYYTNEGVSK